MTSLFIDEDSSYEDLIELFRAQKHTRFPSLQRDNRSYRWNCQRQGFTALRQAGRILFIQHYERTVFYHFEYKKTSELLMEMKEESVSFAVVLDEYGATAGIITLENLLEEIVGDIHDEYDDSEEDDITEIIPDREYIAKGSARLDDLSDFLHVNMDSEDYDSIGGYIIEQLDRLPGNRGICHNP